MQATIEIITNPIDVTQGTTETTQSMTFDISPSYIKGDKGEKGDKGDKGDRGEAGQNGTNGVDGRDGVDGQDAAPLTITSQSLDADGNRVLVFSDGTSVTIPKGQQGDAGTTDYNELNNKPTFKTINSESIVGEGNIVVGGVGNAEYELLLDVTTDEDKPCAAPNYFQLDFSRPCREFIMFLDESGISGTTYYSGRFSVLPTTTSNYSLFVINTGGAFLSNRKYKIFSCQILNKNVISYWFQSTAQLSNYYSSSVHGVAIRNDNSYNSISSIVFCVGTTIFAGSNIKVYGR